MKNIVIIGGGTGTFTLLSGLRKYPSNNTVIVSSADDGGSTGQLRKELGVFPPGDLRQCLIGLSYSDKPITDLFSYRFEKGGLAGHTVGNIILAALEKTTGSIEAALETAAKMLNVRGQVLPASLTPAVLSAVLKNGKKLIGEHTIDDQNPIGKAVHIKSLYLSPAKANPKAILALEQADVIVFGPGDLYTSILPNLLVKGVAETISKSKAKKILVTNIMTKFGQTDDFNASDFVKVLQKFLGNNKLDAVIVNSKKPKPAILAAYSRQKAKLVELDDKVLAKLGLKVAAANLISELNYKKALGDNLQRSFLRHDSDMTAKIIWEMV